MSTVDIALNQLSAAILETKEYKEYDLQRNRVKEDPSLKEQIDEFRKQNYELQVSADNAFEKMEEFERKYSDFWEDEMVADFLSAELALCRMMQQVSLRLTEALDFE